MAVRAAGRRRKRESHIEHCKVLDKCIAICNMASMSIHPIPPDDAPGADHAADPAVQRAERRLRVLAELTEIGMELARGLTAVPAENAADAAGAGDKGRTRRRDPAEVFADLSRAIR